MSELTHYTTVLLGTLLFYFVSVGSFVTLGVLVGRVLARNDEMDEAQARVFGAYRASWRERAWGQLIECWAASFDLLLRALWLLRILPRPRDPGSGTPIVLLPGYTENAGAMWWIARRLRLRGFRPVLVDFPSTFASIERNVAFLRQKLQEVCAITGSQRVAIVAHSMGGVVARALLLSDPNHVVITVVALSSPFRGTHMARLGAFLGLGESVIDMSPSSPFAHRFLPSATATVPIRCIVGEQENIVAPPWSCVLPASEVHLLSVPVGHDAPLLLAEAYARVEHWLLQDGVRRADSSDG
jgi:pimeloyl-ACP methyl ester carboxylesterase